MPDQKTHNPSASYLQAAERAMDDHLAAARQLQNPSELTHLSGFSSTGFRRKQNIILGWLCTAVVGAILIFALIVWGFYRNSLDDHFQAEAGPEKSAVLAGAPVVPMDHNLAVFSFDRGMTFLESGDLYEAGQMFNKAVSADPAYLPAHLNLAYIYLQHDSFTDAAYHLNCAFELDANHPRVLYLYGLYYGLQGDLSRAEYYLSQVKKNSNTTILAESVDFLLQDLEHYYDRRFVTYTAGDEEK